MRFPPPHRGSRVKATLPSHLPSLCLKHAALQLRWDHSDVLSHQVTFCVYYLLPPTSMGSPLSLLFCPGCTWHDMGDALSLNSAHIGPTLTLPEAFVNRLEGKRLEEKKNDHRTKQKYMCRYFPKCDFFTSIFSEAELLNFFQEFLHRLLPSNLPVHLHHSKDAFSLSHLKTMGNRTNPPNRFSQL